MRKRLLTAFVLLVFATCARAAADPLAIAKGLAAGRYAGFAYGSFGEKKIDCVQFLVAVLEEVAAKGGSSLSAATKKAVLIANLTPEELKDLQGLVERSDPKIRGVQTALVDARLGSVVAAKDARAGDLVQYWYKLNGKWAGHAGIVERVDRGLATIYGSHKTTLQRERDKKPAERKGGIGSGPVFRLTDARRKVFVVRWTR